MDYSRPDQPVQLKQKLLADIYTQKELKNISKELHLPATGKKSDLCRRIVDKDPVSREKPEVKSKSKPESKSKTEVKPKSETKAKAKPRRPFLGQTHERPRIQVVKR